MSANQELRGAARVLEAQPRTMGTRTKEPIVTFALSSLLVQTHAELAEAADVVLAEEAEIGDAVKHDGDALEAEAEGVAGVLLGIVADLAEDLGIDHAAAADFQPFLALDLATGA